MGFHSVKQCKYTASHAANKSTSTVDKYREIERKENVMEITDRECNQNWIVEQIFETTELYFPLSSDHNYEGWEQSDGEFKCWRPPRTSEFLLQTETVV